MMTTNHQVDISDIPILDIRQEQHSSSLLDSIHDELHPEENGAKRLPTLLLYDEPGLRLFEDVTYLEEYYLTNAEIEVLRIHADSIAKLVQTGSQMIELGSGNLRKVSILLHALEKAGKDVEYFALDLSLPELKRTLLSAHPEKFIHVKFRGLHGTYDDGLAWLKRSGSVGKPRYIMSLGSSLGNLTPVETTDFLKRFSGVLGSSDALLIGLDACQDEDRVFHAYNDKEGTTRKFYLNGLGHANALIGNEAFKQGDWDVVGEYNDKPERHQAFYVALANVVVDGAHIEAGERIGFEESYKYSIPQSSELWQNAGLAVKAIFGNINDDYHVHVLSSPPFSFALDPAKYAAQPTPSLEEFQQLWAAWDTITRQMIPEHELLSKPIELRNCCIFYLGHIPTFLDIYVTKATRGSPTPPDFYTQIFERGIDPDVDNPENCHAHSEIPDTWPRLDEILAFQDRVRRRVTQLYDDNAVEKNKMLGRCLWLGFEHEAMHLETLLYMFIQSDQCRPPPGVAPDFESLSNKARNEQVPNEWIKVPTTLLTQGLDDPNDESGSDDYFGWDNEIPQRQVNVEAFEAKARPITNEDFARYIVHKSQQTLPALWTTSDDNNEKQIQASSNNIPEVSRSVHVNDDSAPLSETFLGNKYVKTVYGPVPLRHALDWPMIASYDELSACANWMGGRIPTAEEVRSIYKYVDILNAKEAEEVQTKNVSAVNGHLLNNGVDESPPSHHHKDGASSGKRPANPQKLFTNLENCNVGFKNYHPTPVTHHGDKLCGQGDFGGVWEWTSTVLAKHEGFKAMELYPGYTADFFDQKHNVILGGSWATHPRLAGRKSFVNWYQRNYPYAWAGARLVRDI